MNENKNPSILLVGAGAVGQAYGYHLWKAGAQVSFFIKPKYEEELKKGFALYPLNRNKSQRSHPIHWKEFQLQTSLEDAASQKWDWIVLCISSTALRGDWRTPFVKAFPTTPFLSLQPAIGDKELLLKELDENLLLQGTITLSSYTAPLEGEPSSMQGMAYWFPPFTPQPISGKDEKRVKQLVNLFNKGGLKSKKHKNVEEMTLLGSAILMSHLTALESVKWSFRELARSSSLVLANQAMKEIFQIVSKDRGVKLPFARHLVTPFAIKMVLKLSKYVIPFDFEKFLQYHFTKVGDQTRLMMQGYIDLGKKHQLSTVFLQQLEDHLQKQSNAEFIGK